MQAEVKELVELRQMIAQFDAGHENTVGPLKARRDALQAKITEEPFLLCPCGLTGSREAPQKVQCLHINLHRTEEAHFIRTATRAISSQKRESG